MYYIYGIIIGTIVLIILRIIFYFDPSSRFAELRDVDYRTLYDLMDGGLPNYYNQVSIGNFRGIYLYYWYFMFYPFYLMPINIGVYIWDALRLVSSIYVAKQIYKITENKKDLVAFFILSGVGFFADAYLNNTNWLLGLLLFLSYSELEKDRKWIAGILFAIAMYKINIIAFPIILLIVQKIKFKDIIYFIVPLAILCIPYVIFPEYFIQMFHNWTFIENTGADQISLFMRIYLISWQAFQTAQLMFMSLLVLYFLINVKDEKWRDRLRIIIVAFLLILNLSFPLVLWQI